MTWQPAIFQSLLVEAATLTSSPSNASSRSGRLRTNRCPAGELRKVVTHALLDDVAEHLIRDVALSNPTTPVLDLKPRQVARRRRCH